MTFIHDLMSNLDGDHQGYFKINMFFDFAPVKTFDQDVKRYDVSKFRHFDPGPGLGY